MTDSLPQVPLKVEYVGHTRNTLFEYSFWYICLFLLILFYSWTNVVFISDWLISSFFRSFTSLVPEACIDHVCSYITTTLCPLLGICINYVFIYLYIYIYIYIYSKIQMNFLRRSKAWGSGLADRFRLYPQSHHQSLRPQLLHSWHTTIWSCLERRPRIFMGFNQNPEYSRISHRTFFPPATMLEEFLDHVSNSPALQLEGIETSTNRNLR